MQYRRVVATAKRVANFRQAMIGQFLRERHRNLPRAGYRSGAAFRQQVADPDLEIVSDGFLDVFDRNQPCLQRKQITQGFFGEIQADRPFGET